MANQTPARGRPRRSILPEPNTPGWTNATEDLFKAPLSPSPKKRPNTRRSSILPSKKSVTLAVASEMGVKKSSRRSSIYSTSTTSTSPAVTRSRRSSMYISQKPTGRGAKLLLSPTLEETSKKLSPKQKAAKTRTSKKTLGSPKKAIQKSPKKTKIPRKNNSPKKGATSKKSNKDNVQKVSPKKAVSRKRKTATPEETESKQSSAKKNKDVMSSSLEEVSVVQKKRKATPKISPKKEHTSNRKTTKKVATPAKSPQKKLTPMKSRLRTPRVLSEEPSKRVPSSKKASSQKSSRNTPVEKRVKLIGASPITKTPKQKTPARKSSRTPALYTESAIVTSDHSPALKTPAVKLDSLLSSGKSPVEHQTPTKSQSKVRISSPKSTDWRTPIQGKTPKMPTKKTPQRVGAGKVTKITSPPSVFKTPNGTPANKRTPARGKTPAKAAQILGKEKSSKPGNSKPFPGPRTSTPLITNRKRISEIPVSEIRGAKVQKLNNNVTLNGTVAEDRGNTGWFGWCNIL